MSVAKVPCGKISWCAIFGGSLGCRVAVQMTGTLDDGRFDSMQRSSMWMAGDQNW